MNEAKMSVVMTCYNQAEYIRRAVESVLAQKTDFGVRLIITDDNSTKDDSRRIIGELAAEHPDRIVALLNTENGRYLKNVLRAMAEVRTEYFTLLDADDYWTDDGFLQSAYDFLEANREHAIYCRNVTCLHPDGTSHPWVPESFGDCEMSMEDYYRAPYIMSQTLGMVFRNVVYGAGVPEFMESVVGSVHERPFEGDRARFLMHLRLGKAHFTNRSAGVYRILTSGIWCRLSPFEKKLMQARGQASFALYFTDNPSFWVCCAYRDLSEALSLLPSHLKAGGRLDDSMRTSLAASADWIAENRSLLDDRAVMDRGEWLSMHCRGRVARRASGGGLLDKWRYKLWKHLGKRLGLNEIRGKAK